MLNWAGSLLGFFFLLYVQLTAKARYYYHKCLVQRYRGGSIRGERRNDKGREVALQGSFWGFSLVNSTVFLSGYLQRIK